MMRPAKQFAKPPPPRLESLRPVKQKRALLKSNPPRDNWIEGDEITVSTFGEANTSPKQNLEVIISESSHALKTSKARCAVLRRSQFEKTKTSLSECPFFRSNPRLFFSGNRLGGRMTGGAGDGKGNLALAPKM